MSEKEKKIHTGHGVYKLGEKYVCEECDHEVELDEICPACKKDVDWEQVRETVVRAGGF